MPALPGLNGCVMRIRHHWAIAQQLPQRRSRRLCLRIGIEDVTRLDRTALGAMGLRGVALPRPDCVHLIVGPQAEAAAAALRQLLSDRPMVPDPHDAAVQASPGGHS